MQLVNLNRELYILSIIGYVAFFLSIWFHFPNEIDVVMTLHFLLHTCKLSGLRPTSASCNCNLKFARLVEYIGASIWTPTNYVLMLIWVLHVCQSFGYICTINADVLWCILSWLWILHLPELSDVKQIDIFLLSHFGGLSPPSFHPK